LLTEDGLPSSFENCTELQFLRLSYNLMGGQLQEYMFQKLTKLTHLEIESNFFTGTMPYSIGQLQDLVYLYMRRNSMKYNLNFLKPGQMKNLCKCNGH
jgi:Leucine-rich repeat (LRR) protein